MKPHFKKCFWFEDKLILIYKKCIEVILPEHFNSQRILLKERAFPVDKQSRNDENNTSFDANVIKDAQFINNQNGS